MTLEQLARDNGVLWSDKITPCTAKVAVDTAHAVNATVAGLLARSQGRDADQCVVRPFGFELTTASFAMVSILSIVQRHIAFFMFTHRVYQRS